MQAYSLARRPITCTSSIGTPSIGYPSRKTASATAKTGEQPTETGGASERAVGPRRREPRRDGRQAASKVAHQEHASCDAEEVDHNVEIAEELNSKEIVIADITNAEEASKDIENYVCELCYSNFKNLRGLRIHK